MPLRTASGPSGGHNPRALRTWKRKHNRRRKWTQQQQAWCVSWPRAIEIPARLPGGLISLFFFKIAQLCPMGGFFFYTLRGPAFWGAFAHVMRLSWEPFRWKTNKVRPVAEAWLFLVCVLPTAGHQALGGRGWLPLPWRTESGQGGGPGAESGPLWAICLGRSGVLTECLKGAGGACQGCGLGPQIPGELVGGRGRWTLCSRRLP